MPLSTFLDLWKHNVKPKDALDTTHLAHQFHSFSLEKLIFRNYKEKYIKKSLILENSRINS
ncbi:hypothetical protein CW576_07060 [Campylobacter jejuni]|nr:hypothetical protein [Campylobacter jejuni]EAH5332998.1 hypothetical protein [Campylobacter jejuni]EAH7147771.1 hypothetical protein [Campylobacter jejuni]EAH9307595.1 hypothetical protein [Campylobacter jejuni]EAI4845721.1 hypothetical protein [Campylobacter jejuni]